MRRTSVLLLRHSPYYPSKKNYDWSEVQERPYEFEMTVVESTRFAFASEAVSGDFSGAMPLEETTGVTGRARAYVHP